MPISASITNDPVWKDIRNGNKAAYDRMFIQYWSALCEFASQFISDTEAEELVQNMMIWIWENKETINIEKSLKSYLFSSVRNRCYNAIRDGKTREKIHNFLYERMKDEIESPDYYLANELAINIDKAISELPEKYRETFIMSRFDEMSYPEIAGKMNVSVKTVEYRMSQSLKLLRIRLKDYLPLLIFILKL